MSFIGDVTKTNHEPVWLVFNSTCLGLIDAGQVTVSFADSWVEQMSHQTGDALLEGYFKPGSPTIKVKLLEILTLTNWEVAFPTGSKQSDGASGTRMSSTLITAGITTPFAGIKASSIAQKLILRPATQYVDAATEKSRDFWLPKAFCSSVGDMIFETDSPQALDMTFRGLFQPINAEGEHNWIYGLSTGVWVDA